MDEQQREALLADMQRLKAIKDAGCLGILSDGRSVDSRKRNDGNTQT